MATNTEDFDVFDLKGEHSHFYGQGDRSGSEEETEEFTLTKGLLIWKCGHDGLGSFSVTLRNGPYFRPWRLLILPFPFSLPLTKWRPYSLAVGSDKEWWGALQVGPDVRGFAGIFSDDGPEPSKRNLLKVESSGPWFCHLFQPALGQLEADFPYRASGDADSIIAGFFRVGSLPLLLSAQHDGGGEFRVGLMSFDGTDVCEVVEEDGQCRLEQCQIEAKPGKEYLLLVQATGTWNLEFTESY